MWRRLSMLPVERSSSTDTSSPRSRYVSARCDPMNPAPPVMSTRISPHPPKNRRADLSPGRYCPASSTMILEEPALSGERMPRSTPQVGSLPAASISEYCPQKLATRQPTTITPATKKVTYQPEARVLMLRCFRLISSRGPVFLGETVLDDSLQSADSPAGLQTIGDVL